MTSDGPQNASIFLEKVVGYSAYDMAISVELLILTQISGKGPVQPVIAGHPSSAVSLILIRLQIMVWGLDLDVILNIKFTARPIVGAHSSSWMKWECLMY